ncbi:MAG: hypothetical protein DCC58_12120, partial [Chloroflexi bacterium]
MAEFRMPSLGADMEAGTLVRWLVAPGDRVKRGDFIAEVETQKGVIDVEIFEDGTVAEFLVEEGAHVPVGTPLARITPAGEAAAPSQPAPQAAPAPMPEPALAVAASTPSMPAPTVPAQPDATPAPATSDRQRIRATPVARKRSEELGVDLASVTGTGPGGAIVLVDVEQAAKSQPAPAETPAEPKLAIPTPQVAEAARPATPP